MSEAAMTTQDVHDVLWSALIDANDCDTDEHTYVRATLRALHEMLGGQEGVRDIREHIGSDYRNDACIRALFAVLDAAEEEAKR